ncbi:MAG: alpha-amylase family glycosyl hydrolase [Flavisolibacter sp.]
MAKAKFPSLYQVNTRVWMTALSEKLGRTATLDDISDADLDKLAVKGFDWIWLLSVWQTGKKGQEISRSNPGWLKEFQDTLPDLKEEDIAGSGFAITAYRVHEQLGGDEALARLRKRLKDRGFKLMLDFVPNHTAIDHEWVEEYPAYYIAGNETLLATEPANYIKLQGKNGEMILAHGRDPYFPGWPDTLQLNYGNPELQNAMTNVLIKIAGQCDGVRCDMAMLVLPDVFQSTWNISCPPFWSTAIQRVHKENSHFHFMAEVYWDLEWRMQQEGFNYTYDKRLYDRLEEGNANAVRGHLYGDKEYQAKMARFLENHDEPRAAATFTDDKHMAAAIITFLSMGLRFFHQGQFEGKKKRISPHLVRGPVEPVNEKLKGFYDKLLSILCRPAFRNGSWQLLDAGSAWEGNSSNDGFICYAWEDEEDKLLVLVNYSPTQGQCYLRLPFDHLEGKQWKLRDLFSDVTYIRPGDELHSTGLYLDEAGWKYYVFALE